MAEKAGLKHHVKIISKQEFWDALPDVMYHMDEPLEVSLCFLTQALHKIDLNIPAWKSGYHFWIKRFLTLQQSFRKKPRLQQVQPNIFSVKLFQNFFHRKPMNGRNLVFPFNPCVAAAEWLVSDGNRFIYLERSRRIFPYRETAPASEWP